MGIRPARPDEAGALSKLALASHAAGFYRALGANHEADIPSSIPGRTIPLFTYRLGDLK